MAPNTTPLCVRTPSKMSVSRGTSSDFGPKFRFKIGQIRTSNHRCAERAPRRPTKAPRWPPNGSKTAQDGSKMALIWPKMAQDGSKMALIWPKMAPRWLESGPRWPTKAPRRPPNGSKTAQDGSKMARNWPDTAQDSSKMAHTWPSQRLRYNLGCGGIRGASYNPPHPSGVLGVIGLEKIDKNPNYF